MAIFTLNSKKNCSFFVSYIKSFLEIWREPSQFLNISALEGLVSYKTVSYKKKRVWLVLTATIQINGESIAQKGDKIDDGKTFVCVPRPSPLEWNFHLSLLLSILKKMKNLKIEVQGSFFCYVSVSTSFRLPNTRFFL